MSSLKSSVALIGAFAASALAHGTVTGFKTDGVYNGGFLLDYYYAKVNGQEMPETAGWYAENLDNGFVEPNSYGTADIICHKNAEAAPISASVAAGGTVEFQWSAWPESHIGPVLTYVAKCDGDCADADKTTLKWVKIDEAGINLETQKWAAIDLIENNNTWVTTVPETLAAGNYVFRHEIIAMHGAGSENGAQNYPQCLNIAITGSGTDNPEGVLGTELYTSTDPGILFNPYTTLTSYEIPGPALYGSGSNSGSGSGSSASPSASPSASSPASVATETPSAPTVSVPVASPSAAAPTTFVARPSVATSAAAAPSQTAAAEPSTPSDESSSSLPETFTLDTFIDWLKSAAGARNTRRHARALN